MCDLVRENLACQRLGGAVGAFEHDNAEIAEGAVEHAGKGVRHAGAGCVRLSQIGEQFGREFGLRQRDRQLVDDAVDLAAECDGADWRMPRAWRARQRDRAPLQFVVEHGDRRDFVPVVILRFDPEDRDSRHAVILRHPRGKPGRRQSFIEREQRAAEQSCLLTCDNRDRLGIREARRSLTRGGRRVTPLELLCEKRAQLCPLSRMPLRVRDRGGPGRGLRRIAGKKRRQR